MGGRIRPPTTLPHPSTGTSKKSPSGDGACRSATALTAKEAQRPLALESPFLIRWLHPFHHGLSQSQRLLDVNPAVTPSAAAGYSRSRFRDLGKHKPKPSSEQDGMCKPRAHHSVKVICVIAISLWSVTSIPLRFHDPAYMALCPLVP
jgi:hypothetical protein